MLSDKIIPNRDYEYKYDLLTITITTVPFLK